MMQHIEPQDVTNPAPSLSRASAWTRRYGNRHKLRRLHDFPEGVAPPRRVRVYRRMNHFVVQWWDPQAKRSLSDRVEGDLIDAIARAREIDQRLVDFKSAGQPRRRLTHETMVQAYLTDLGRRADAGEISVATVRRYGAALDHYLAFVDQLEMGATYRYATAVDRAFALRFAAYLSGLMISPNGHSNTDKRRMQRPDLVLDAVRALFAWAADPDRGNLLPTGFRNPFLRSTLQRREHATDMTAAPDVTVEMATEFLRNCDDYRLRLFTPLILYGLRASEPVFVFHELIDESWLNVSGLQKLDYSTKGLRNKRLPLLGAVASLLNAGRPGPRKGLVFVRRSVAEGKERPPLLGAALEALAYEYQQRLRSHNRSDMLARIRIRDDVIRDAGGLSYDLINGEFHRIARRLKWPACATLKDFRHLFATALVSAAVPEPMRRYLMGHTPGRDAIVAYTHLDRLTDHYRRAVEQEYGSLLAILRSRVS